MKHTCGKIYPSSRGSGRQKVGAILTLCSYYVIALPLGAVLVFVFDMELIGIWLSLGFAVFLSAMTAFVIRRKC